MSADNWTDCPQCRARVYESTSGMRRAAAIKGLQPTLREDYEWWSEDGYVRGVYRCGCRVCGLRFEHLVSAPIPISTPGGSL